MAPHSQSDAGARPHLSVDEWNRPTPVRRRLSLIQAIQAKPNSAGLVLVLKIKARNRDVLSLCSVFHLFSSTRQRMPSPASLSNRFRADVTNRRLDRSFSSQASEDYLKRPCNTVTSRHTSYSTYEKFETQDVFRVKILFNMRAKIQVCRIS